MSGSQAFNIRSSDDWWQMCIHMLMHSCEVILVDLSKVKEGTGWELNQLRAKNLLSKCVFIIGEEHIADIGPVLEEYFPPGHAPAVHVYSNKGQPSDRQAFDTRFDAIMESGLAGWGR
jgi:hypothetical protein